MYMCMYLEFHELFVEVLVQVLVFLTEVRLQTADAQVTLCVCMWGGE